ncbi:hypothetical protein ACPCG0_09380 [Propionibacteriaceae bacterium Y1923]|uniref:hypothetical protein n=1 Tax=Aestuariimicrobium sp. Y1814 TaxID=3418742 RepID=UPI003C1D8A17
MTVLPAPADEPDRVVGLELNALAPSDAWGYRALAARMCSDPIQRAWLTQMTDFVNARLDLSDHRMLVLLKLLLTSDDVLPDDAREQIRRAVLGFRYSMAEPGRDSMCTWTENHQLLFATSEYLAGQFYPDETFTNDGRTGSMHRASAHVALLAWLDDRYHHGFSEWLSNTYYELMACALVMLVDHAENQDLATRAAMVLDLLMLDLALHRFEGHFQASGGRVHKHQKMNPARAEVESILASAFTSPPRFNHDQLAGVFVARQKYRVPDVIQEIAAADGARQIRTSQGRDIGEALADVDRRLYRAGEDERFAALVRTAWGQQAYVTPESISLTMKALRRYQLQENRFMAPLATFDKVRQPAAQRALLRTLNPVIQGTALNRANVFTYRTPNYLVSSTQQYQVGQFGDQQHLWHAAFPRDINIFATHPGSTNLPGEGRPPSPSAWVGNGVNPAVGQFNNVVLALHDLRVRRGYLEARRHLYSHLYFPFVKFDETTLGTRVLAGRIGTSLVGIVSLQRMEMVSPTEVVQRGQVTGWALVASDLSEFSSLQGFVTTLKKATLHHLRGALVFNLEHSNSSVAPPAPHEYRLEWKGGFLVDQVAQNPHYWRHDNDWVAAARGADRILVRGRDKTLRLEWTTCTREES